MYRIASRLLDLRGGMMHDVSKSMQNLRMFMTKGNITTSNEMEFGNLLYNTKDTSNNGNVILISIEGNIGAGKSTLLQNLRKRKPSWVFIDEPVGIWSNFRNAEGESMLELFYKDRRRWAYTFQNCALLTRFQNIEVAIAKHLPVTLPSNEEATNIKKQVFITERCLDTDFEVFTKMLHAEGSIDQLEYDLYTRWFQQLKINATPLSAIVFVDTTPQVCHKRIKARSRDGEDGISEEYLQQIHEQQIAWIKSENIPVSYLQESPESIDNVISFVDGILASNTLQLD